MQTIRHEKRKSGSPNQKNGYSHNLLESLVLKGILAMTLLFTGAIGALAQVGGLTQTGNMTVCLNATEPYGVIPTPGSTYTWSVISVAGGNGTVINGAAPNNLVTVTWTSAGTCILRVVETNSLGCIGPNNDIQITVDPLSTITLTSPGGTDAQTVCLNTAIANITYATTGATGATFAGLPAGVTGAFAANVVTISGTPTVSGTFNYTVTLTGGCGNVTATGSITVNPLPIPTITPSVNPVCLGTTGVVYTTEPGMTNYTWVVTGGLITSGGTTTDNTVTVTWNGTGPYSVSVNYSNGCPAASPTVLNVTVNPLPVTSPIYHN